MDLNPHGLAKKDSSISVQFSLSLPEMKGFVEDLLKLYDHFEAGEEFKAKYPHLDNFLDMVVEAKFI